MNPMSIVARPMTSSVVTRVFLRPIRSPKCPNRIEPNGRATKATPSVANDATVAAAGPSAGKKMSPNTSAAAVP